MKIEKIDNFSNISQRIIYGFNFSFSEFHPINSQIANETAQKELHLIMQKLIEILYHNPALINLSVDKDESYEWLVCGNQFPELQKKYQSICKALYNFYRLLFISALYGEIFNNKLIIQKDKLKLKKCHISQSISKF